MWNVMAAVFVRLFRMFYELMLNNFAPMKPCIISVEESYCWLLLLQELSKDMQVITKMYNVTFSSESPVQAEQQTQF